MLFSTDAISIYKNAIFIDVQNPQKITLSFQCYKGAKAVDSERNTVAEHGTWNYFEEFTADGNFYILDHITLNWWDRLMGKTMLSKLQIALKRFTKRCNTVLQKKNDQDKEVKDIIDFVESAKTYDGFEIFIKK